MTINLSSQNLTSVKIIGDKFQMGSLENSESSPVHAVLINSFYVSFDLVSRGDYEEVFGAPFLGDAEDQKNYKLTNEMAIKPATDVSWIRALEYCNRMSKKEGLEEYYQIPENCWEPKKVKINSEANGYRLLTEAEWEFISQNKQKYKEVLNLDDKYYEWVWDGFVKYNSEYKDNPIDQSGNYERVIRGGKHFKRFKAPAADRHMYCDKTSFRLARNNG